MITGALKQMARAMTPDLDITMAEEITQLLEWFHVTFPHNIILLPDALHKSDVLTLEWYVTGTPETLRTAVIRREWSQDRELLRREIAGIKTMMRLSQ